MKKNRSLGKANIVLLLLGFCAIALAAFFMSTDSTSVNEGNTKMPEEQVELAPSNTNTASVKTLVASPVAVEDDSDLYLNREMQAQVLQVADLYEQNSKYPVTSIPVVGERFAEPEKPFEQAEVDSVYPSDEGDFDNPLRIAASVDRLRYYEGDQIIARLIVSGGSVVDYSQISASGSIIAVDDGRDIGLATSFQPYGGGEALEFRAIFDTRSLATGSMPNQAMVKATVSVNGDSPVVQTVPFFYSETTAALLENVMPALQDGAFMKIPLEFSVQQAGYYFVDAFLDDANNGQALLQLKTEGPMNQGNGILTLSAHLSALRDAGSEGPYRLRVVKSFLAGVPGQSRDLPARISQQAGYLIEGIPFSQYDDTPYFDPEVQERIDFLREMGNSSQPESSNVSEELPPEEL